MLSQRVVEKSSSALFDPLPFPAQRQFCFRWARKCTCAPDAPVACAECGAAYGRLARCVADSSRIL
eukprot:scaffold1071_cov252-Pinguiococcus_pyrenoidosus.AAC.4